MEFDATTQVDQLIAGYESTQLIIWITLGVILVALIALGTEFWVNLWGAIHAPSLTFQRLCGEAQWVPGLVVVAMTGMAVAAVIMKYLDNPAVLGTVLNGLDPAVNQQAGTIYEQLDNVFDQMGSDFTIAGNIENIRKFAFQSRSVAMAVPLFFIILWFFWGLGGQLASMIAGNKAGHGYSNLLSALPYAFIVSILSTWFFMMMEGGSGAGKILFMITSLYFLFLHVVLMREHGRYDIGKAIVATVLTVVLTIVFLVVLAFLVAFVMVQIDNYL